MILIESWGLTGLISFFFMFLLSLIFYLFSLPFLCISCPLPHLFSFASLSHFPSVWFRPASFCTGQFLCLGDGLIWQKSEELIWVSSSAQAANVHQYWNGLRVNVLFRALEYSAPTMTLALCTDLCVPACLQTGTQDAQRTYRATGRQCITYRQANFVYVCACVCFLLCMCCSLKSRTLF